MLVLWVPALLLYLRGRGVVLAAGAGAAALVLCLLAIGYPLQRHYLEDRFANAGPESDRRSPAWT